MPMMEVDKKWSEVVTHPSTCGCKPGITSQIGLDHIPSLQYGCMHDLGAVLGIWSVHSCTLALVSTYLLKPESLCPNQWIVLREMAVVGVCMVLHSTFMHHGTSI